MKKNIFINKKQSNFNRLITILMFGLPLFLCGCNTMEGVGTDVKEAGKALERSADKHKPSSRPCPCCSRR